MNTDTDDIDSNDDYIDGTKKLSGQTLQRFFR